MGCVSSTFLNQDEEFSQIGGFSHHIVSLTSTTYGLLTMDPPPPASAHKDSPTKAPPTPIQTPPPRVNLGSLFSSPLSEPRSLRYQPLETINSWDLMAGLDSEHIPSFRFKPSKSPASNQSVAFLGNDENISPNVARVTRQELNSFLEGFEMLCPPNGENRVVLYTTTLRGVRKTFEDCTAVRSAIQGLGILVCERDISMDRGFRDELRELMKGKGTSQLIPPRLFVKGRYIGGVEEVMKLVEEGFIGELVRGLPVLKGGFVCEGCGNVGFLPCFTCHGSCKMVMVVKEGSDVGTKQGDKNVVMRCSDCNENGLVLCPICS